MADESSANVIAQLVSTEGDTAGPQLDLPVAITPAQLETVLHGLLPKVSNRTPYGISGRMRLLSDERGVALHYRRPRSITDTAAAADVMTTKLQLPPRWQLQCSGASRGRDITRLARPMDRRGPTASGAQDLASDVNVKRGRTGGGGTGGGR
jgi:hypothetical protein